MFIFKKKTFILVILFYLISFNTSFSQNNQLLSVAAIPSSPKPGGEVTINVTSYLINLDKSKISWYVDGILKKEGVAETKNIIKVGGIEKTTTVRIVVTEKNGTKSESTLKIKPSSASLIVEPFSYTPLFYKGKSNFTYEGSSKVVVIPEISDTNGKKISVENLIFKWSKDSIVITAGVGKNYLLIKNNIPVDEIHISVEIYSLDEVLLLKTSKIIKPNITKILLYENSPLYGVLYNKSLSLDYFLGDKEEIKIISEPLFFDKDISNLEYIWSVNNVIIDKKEEKNQLILKKVESAVKGSVDVLLSIKSKDKIFQSAENSLHITYGQ